LVPGIKVKVDVKLITRVAGIRRLNNRLLTFAVGSKKPVSEVKINRIQYITNRLKEV
jgi:hypothetical protein